MAEGNKKIMTFLSTQKIIIAKLLIEKPTKMSEVYSKVSNGNIIYLQINKEMKLLQNSFIKLINYINMYVQESQKPS